MFPELRFVGGAHAALRAHVGVRVGVYNDGTAALCVGFGERIFGAAF